MQSAPNGRFCFYDYIPMILQDASFRMPERFMVKAHLFINGVLLKIDAMKSMICSGIPVGLV